MPNNNYPITPNETPMKEEDIDSDYQDMPDLICSDCGNVWNGSSHSCISASAVARISASAVQPVKRKITFDCFSEPKRQKSNTF